MLTIIRHAVSVANRRSFEYQAKILQAKGLAQESELASLYPLLRRLGKIEKGQGIIPFLLIAQNGFTLPELMAKVVLNGKKGESLLDDKLLTNLYPLPPKHYLVVGVEIGWTTLGIKPSQAIAQFANYRLATTAIEGIMAVTYEPEILQYLSIDLLGSRYGDDRTPYLTIRDGEPELNAFWHDGSYLGFGAMSCKWRLWPGVQMANKNGRAFSSLFPPTSSPGQKVKFHGRMPKRKP